MLDNRACTPPPPPFQLGRRGGKNFTKVFVGGGGVRNVYFVRGRAGGNFVWGEGGSRNFEIEIKTA